MFMHGAKASTVSQVFLSGMQQLIQPRRWYMFDVSGEDDGLGTVSSQPVRNEHLL